MLAVPDLEAKVTAARALRRRGFEGLLSATHLYPEEYGPIIEAGCDVSYNYYTEAGVGFARHTYEKLDAPQAAELPFAEPRPAEPEVATRGQIPLSSTSLAAGTEPTKSVPDPYSLSD